MKIKTQASWMAVAALAMVAGMQGAVRQTSAGTGESGSATAPGGQASASAAQAASVSAELSKKLDAKDAKVGDEVVAKTTSEARFADGTKLPKGSKLVGHVTDVQAKSHDNHDSHLAFSFDHAVLKDGRELPIQVMTRSIAAPAQLAASAGTDDMMGAGGGAGGGGPRAGGGGVGPANSAGGTVRGATGLAAGASSATAGSLNNATSGIDGTANGMGSTAGSTANLGPNGTALNNAAGVNGALSGPDMPVGNLSAVTFNTVSATVAASPGGVTGSAGVTTATILTGHGKNVSLDSGSQMSLAVALR
jgi:hypothetical protein